jgi:V8-like Glu-specific endopeptidase
MNRPYLKLAAKDPVLSESVFTIGYPFGTPAKVSPNARVSISNPAKQSYLTTLDVFEGNSGSPVFNLKNEVVGILIAGTPSSKVLVLRFKDLNL